MCSPRFALEENDKESGMTRTVFAMTAAALLMVAVSGTSQAVPIAPPAGIAAADEGNLTPVYWRYHRHWHHPYWRHRHWHHRYWHHRYWHHRRHCWRGRWGHVHCRWW